MLPIRDTVPSRNPPLATWALILANGVVFLLEMTMPPPELERIFCLFGGGPVDPQLGRYPAASILSTVAEKPAPELDGRTLAEKAMAQVTEGVRPPVRSDMPEHFLSLMNPFPQPVRRKPTVEYLPEPRRVRGDRETRG